MGHWKQAVQQLLGQSHATSIVSLERGWANSKPPVALPWSNYGPSAACHSAGAGPIPHYWQHLFQRELGQSNAISFVSIGGLGLLKDISSTTLEQLQAISSMSFGRCWANFSLLAMPVSRGAWLIPCYQHYLSIKGLGQLKAVGSSTLK
jgi:hypothetical protein